MRNNRAIARALNLAIRDRHQLQTPYVIVESPPGAGKTWLIELIATIACLYGLRVGIACPRAQQAFDLVRRLRAASPSQALRLLVGQDRSLPADLRTGSTYVWKGEFVFGPRGGLEIEVGTVSKLAYLAARDTPYDLLVFDEAYQVTLAELTPLLSRAERFLLVGDPGQLPPLVQIDTEPFQAATYRVHAPAPVELLRHAPGSPVVRLEVSHRLPRDTVGILQPVLYPSLPFRSAAAPRQRRLMTHLPGYRGDAVDHAIDMVVGGASLVVLVLPAAKGVQSVIDVEATELIADVVERLLERQIGPAGGRPFRPGDIGVLDPHVASGAYLRRTLQQRQVPVGSLMVDTPEVWQGLQRALMVVRHPVSNPFPSAFDLEPGRFCVAVTRHRFGCIVVAREGVDDVLGSHQHDCGARPLGDTDAVWQGIEMHRALWDGLRRRGRLIRV